jgi:stage IV sporulation protein B
MKIRSEKQKTQKAHMRFSLILLIIYALYIFSGTYCYAYADEASINAFSTNISYTGAAASEPSAKKSDLRISSRIYELLFGKSKERDSRLYLIPGGDVFGIRVNEAHVTVSEAKEGSPIRRGDKILSVGGMEITEPEDVSIALGSCRGGPIKIEVLRGAEKMTVTVIPKYEDGAYKLGISLRKVACGIGTVTFIEPESGAFGGLGHGICDSESGKPIEITSGEVVGAVLGKVNRGEVGKPGELSGVLSKRCIGRIDINNECGVFGILDSPAVSGITPIPVAQKTEIQLGKAEIISTVKNGKKATYSIEITEIDQSSTGSKSFKIKVTDPMLISLTGGIVRGMSGSPIIQDGKLVGAVTHVMVANPTEGYGIFIENMLNAAENTVPKAA